MLPNVLCCFILFNCFDISIYIYEAPEVPLIGTN